MRNFRMLDAHIDLAALWLYFCIFKRIALKTYATNAMSADIVYSF